MLWLIDLYHGLPIFKRTEKREKLLNEEPPPGCSMVSTNQSYAVERRGRSRQRQTKTRYKTLTWEV